jgi:anti-sigma regulatory factor (Ser/Thr protein kinase)
VEGLYQIQAPRPGAGEDAFAAWPREDGSVLFALADTKGDDPLSLAAAAAFQDLLGKFQAGVPDLRRLALWCNRSIQAGPCSQVPIRALFGHWHPRKGRLHLLSAGMPQALWHKAAWARTVPIPISGTPLGLLAEPRIEEKVVWLRQGDRILMGREGFFRPLGPATTPFQEDAASLWRGLALELISEAARAHGTHGRLPALALEQPSLYLGPDEIAFSLPSDVRVLDEACNVLGTFLESRGWLAASDRFATLMAVREALTNAIRHGNAGLETPNLHLRAQKAPDGGFQVLVLDEGLGFDLEAHRAPVALVSGLDGGIPLIRQFTKRVAMVGGELTMTFS